MIRALPGESGLEGGVMPDRYPAIEDQAVIGDLHTVAPVDTGGTPDWCCLPRFDSPAVFASLLDADRGGVRRSAGRTYRSTPCPPRLLGGKTST